MKNDLKALILEEATRIGDELLQKSISEENGLSWRTVERGAKQKQLSWHQTSSIYRGVSGIVLFLLELYKTTGIGRYLTAAIDGAEWSYAHQRNQNSLDSSLLTGRMGVSYMLHELYRTTDYRRYLDNAVEIAITSVPMVTQTNVRNDFLTGKSGTLLGLVHLHKTTKEKRLLDTIEILAEDLLEEAHHGPEGLYWDRTAKQTSALCGFSHGASGLGFVFLELGHYLQNEAFYWLAEQAFRYERYHFDSTINNWPDFRKSFSTIEGLVAAITAYIDGDRDFFTRSQDINFWCHGAAGIGLSRLRAFELMGRDLYEDEARQAITKTIATEESFHSTDETPINFSLCHGVCGNADIFLEAYRVLDDRALWHRAQGTARAVLLHRERGGSYTSGYWSPLNESQTEDASLFMGNAGVGYFFLRVLDPVGVPSILAPRIEAEIEHVPDATQYPTLSITPHELRRRLLKKSFKQTMFVVETVKPELVESYLNKSSEWDSNYITEFVHFIEQIDKGERREQLADVLSLERKKLTLEHDISSNMLIYIKSRVAAARAARVLRKDNTALGEVILHTEPDLELVKTRWNWTQTQMRDGLWEDIAPSPSSCHTLLQPTTEGVVEIPIHPLVYQLLTLFVDAKRVRDVIDGLKTAVGAGPQSESNYRLKLFEQVRELVGAGLLVPSRSSTIPALNSTS